MECKDNTIPISGRDSLLTQSRKGAEQGGRATITTTTVNKLVVASSLRLTKCRSASQICGLETLNFLYNPRRTPVSYGPESLLDNGNKIFKLLHVVYFGSNLLTAETS